MSTSNLMTSCTLTWARAVLYLACLSLLVAQTAHSDPEKPVLLFLGDSLTAGYGLSEEDAYPAHIAAFAAADGYAVEVINAGLSGETTAGGLRRLEWVMRRPIDVLVIALGGNDGLRGIDPDDTRSNIARIIDRARELQTGIQILLIGMEAPPNMGEAFASDFRAVFPRVADEKNVPFLPFLLTDVAGDSALNLADGIHPNVEGHRRIATSVWSKLKTLVIDDDHLIIGDEQKQQAK